MPRDYKVYLEDIFSSIQKIEKYLKDTSFDNFRKNDIKIDAVVRNLEIIGEAAKNIPVDAKKIYTKIDWKKIAGLRDILIHQYFGIDLDILWDIIQNKLPELKKNIRHILK